MKKLLLLLLLSLSYVSSAYVTYTPDGLGGFWGSDGMSYTPDGLGGFWGSDGTSCSPDYGGGFTCYGGGSSAVPIDNSGWEAITNAMGGMGSNLGKSLGGSNSGSSYNPQMAKFMEDVRKAQEANSFKPPIQFSGSWKKVTNTSKGSSYFIDVNTLLDGSDNVFFWQLLNNASPGPDGEKSVTTYVQADCNKMRYKYLSWYFYKQFDAKNQFHSIEYRPDKQWNYAKSGYIDYAIIEEACGKNIAPVEEEEEIWLNCESDITITLRIYPETKEFRLFKDRIKYSEDEDFIYFIDFIDHPDEDIKKYLKYENKLNRKTGKLTQVSYKKSGTLDYDPDTKTFASNYEFRKNFEYQCSRDEVLF